MWSSWLLSSARKAWPADGAADRGPPERIAWPVCWTRAASPCSWAGGAARRLDGSGGKLAAKSARALEAECLRSDATTDESAEAELKAIDQTESNSQAQACNRSSSSTDGMDCGVTMTCRTGGLR